MPSEPLHEPSVEREQLLAAVAALQAQRAVLGAAVIEASLAALRARLAVLDAAAAQALRQVSILFLDIVGSTALTQRLDPEQVHAVMDGALDRCTQQVQAHHGRVLQYAGDNLLAAFGADEAHEDDPELAVRCGLALLAEGRAIGEAVQREHGHAGLDVRVGVHTGRVLLGGGVDAEGTIRGIAVNIAARMEQTAPAGSLRISQDTERLVHGLFEVQAQPPAVLKGVDAPMPSFLVLRARPREFRPVNRGIDGLATAMVGRDAELEVLQQAWAGVAAARRLGAVAVVGEAGLGKSRLLREFEAWRRSQPDAGIALRGRAHPHMQGQTFGLLRDVLVRRLRIGDEDTPQAARAAFEAGVTSLFAVEQDTADAQALAHRLGHLIGLGFADSPHLRGLRDDPRQLRERGFDAATQVLGRLLRGVVAPGVLLLEDLHWADDASLDFLDHLARHHADLPLLTIALARTTLFERRPGALAAWPGLRRLDLVPLGTPDGQALAGALWHPHGEAPAALRELLVARAEGNPFFMEELVKMLIDQGVVEARATGWILHADRLHPGDVPLTLTGVLQARLDGLPAAERCALQEASVIGAVFWDQALRAVAGASALQLPALARRALTLPRPGTEAAGWREYAFSHHLLHQVTYDTVLQRRRRELHANAARWLSGLDEGVVRLHLAQIAAHHERADQPADAAEYWARAAEQAQQRMASETALAQVQRALDLLDRAAGLAGVHDALRWRLLTARWTTLEQLGRRAELLACGDAMQTLAESLGDAGRLAQALWQRSISLGHASDWAGSEHAARQALAQAERAGDTARRLQAVHRVAVARRRTGDHVMARQLAAAGLDEARDRGLLAQQKAFLSALANIAEETGDLGASLQLQQESMALSRELGLRRGEAVALGNLGNVQRLLGDLPQARQHLEEAIALMRGFGDRFMLCAPLCCLAVVGARQGQGQAALALAQEAQALAEDTGSPERARLAWLAQGDALRALGRSDDAARAYEACYRQAREADDTIWLDAAAARAALALPHDDPAAARRWVEPILEWLQGGRAAEGGEVMRIEHACWAALTRSGDPRARAWLQRSHAELQAQAARIEDAAMRERFVHGAPEHLEILAAWHARDDA